MSKETNEEEKKNLIETLGLELKLIDSLANRCSYYDNNDEGEKEVLNETLNLANHLIYVFRMHIHDKAMPAEERLEYLRSMIKITDKLIESFGVEEKEETNE